jgi:hypothetical protein
MLSDRRVWRPCFWRLPWGCGLTSRRRPWNRPRQASAVPAVSPDQFLAVAQDVEPVAEALCRSRDARPELRLRHPGRPGPAGRGQCLSDARPVGAADHHPDARAGGHPWSRRMSWPSCSAMRPGTTSRATSRSSANPRPKAPVSSARSPWPAAEARATSAAPRAGGDGGRADLFATAELEADAIGTAIAFRAGYDPVAGAQLFTAPARSRHAFPVDPSPQRRAHARRAPDRRGCARALGP